MKAIEAGVFTETTRDRLAELESEKKQLNLTIATKSRKHEDALREMNMN